MAERSYPERTVASPAGHAADAGRDVLAWQHGMHVRCGPGASPGAARDRLSVTMEIDGVAQVGTFLGEN